MSLIKTLADAVKLLVPASRIDIFDMNFQFSSEAINVLSLPAPALPRKGLFVRGAAFFWKFLKALYNFTKTKQQRIHLGVVLFFATTKNQRDSLSPIVDMVESASLVEEGGEAATRFPLFWAYLLAIPFLPLVIFCFFRSTRYQKESYRYIFDIYWLTYGYYIVARIWLFKLKPKALVVSNDHAMPIRVLVKAARELHIPTFYMQHACVTDKFPPLSFDYALLEGMDALRKYERAGTTHAKVFLIGMPKADAFFKKINTNTSVKRVGVCTNQRDSVSAVNSLCKMIRLMLPDLELILRPHPRDAMRIYEWINLAKEEETEFSDPRVDVSFDVLQRIDAIIAGDSSILLEAAYLNVYPLYYDFDGTALDGYGFLKHNLVEYFTDSHEICHKLRELVKNKPPVRVKTKWYCHTVGTLYDGRSTELASSLVQNLLSRNSEIEKQWTRLADVKLEAYELRDELSE